METDFLERVARRVNYAICEGAAEMDGVCYGIGGKRAESLCVSTGDKPTQVMLWVSATNCLVGKKWIRSSSDNWKKPHVHWPWSSWGMRIMVIFSGAS